MLGIADNASRSRRSHLPQLDIQRVDATRHLSLGSDQPIPRGAVRRFPDRPPGFVPIGLERLHFSQQPPPILVQQQSLLQRRLHMP